MSDPYVIRIADQAAKEPECWRAHVASPSHVPGQIFGPKPYRTAADILGAYEALGRPPTPAEVEIINPRWRGPECDDCGAERVDLVRAGDVSCYRCSEGEMGDICRSCLVERLERLREALAALDAG